MNTKNYVTKKLIQGAAFGIAVPIGLVTIASSLAIATVHNVIKLPKRILNETGETLNNIAKELETINSGVENHDH